MMCNVLEEPTQCSVMAQLPSRNLTCQTRNGDEQIRAAQSSSEEDFH